MKLKTYNITYRPDADNRYNTKTVTYQANDMNEAKLMFYAEYPEQENEDYLEIHSPLSNYAVDRENEKSAEIPNNNNSSSTTTTTTPIMKKFNILNLFKTVNEYVMQITLMLVGLIPLLLLGVVLFGDDFFLGNIVVYNIQNILDSMAGFVGIVTLLVIIYFYSKLSDKK